MGTRRTPRERGEWITWLAIGIMIWLSGAFLITFYLNSRSGASDLSQCIASGAYFAVLLIVMAVGNFARVRMLLTLEILYGIGVLVRAVIGTLTSLMIIESPLGGRMEVLLDAFVYPLSGMRYIAVQLTSHFVTEIYWLGLGLSATILVFLACAATMAVGSRLKRERRERRRQSAQRAAAASAGRLEELAGRR